MALPVGINGTESEQVALSFFKSLMDSFNEKQKFMKCGVFESIVYAMQEAFDETAERCESRRQSIYGLPLNAEYFPVLFLERTLRWSDNAHLLPKRERHTPRRDHWLFPAEHLTVLFPERTLRWSDNVYLLSKLEWHPPRRIPLAPPRHSESRSTY
jgi:hypothetical protein